jgi:hypothetical protein
VVKVKFMVYFLMHYQRMDKNILGLIGNTPLLRIFRMVAGDCAEIWVDSIPVVRLKTGLRYT